MIDKEEFLEKSKLEERLEQIDEFRKAVANGDVTGFALIGVKMGDEGINERIILGGDPSDAYLIVTALEETKLYIFEKQKAFQRRRKELENTSETNMAHIMGTLNQILSQKGRN